MRTVRGIMGSATNAPSSRREWEGTARYALVRRIGEGGMGVVFEAYDRERNRTVALKTLHQATPAALYRFKQEFRTLADVSHRNLVRLHDLDATDPEHVFFTMELVPGVSFLAWVRGEAEASTATESGEVLASPEADPSEEEPTMRNDDPHDWRASALHRKPAKVDFDRLRAAMAQLVQGVQALHAAGKLHRDIKPSNVRVTADGRVVLLDFGVATELARAADDKMVEREVVGTASYMAPEQATEEAPTPASDWYSVGVMLHAALTGAPPFTGPWQEVLLKKSLMDAPPPRESVEGVPADLDALCVALLGRDPRKRPTGAEIVHRLRHGATADAGTPPPRPAPLVGRAAHLAELRAAFDAAMRDGPVTVVLRGSSGMGKSALAHYFLDDLVGSCQALTLRGRAYERESVSYKAFDSVVDALSRYLVRTAELGAPTKLPADVAALARIFPVLRRVPRIEAAAGPEPLDPHLVRRRAFMGMRELLATLAEQQPLVVFIDDAQWGDVDSASLLLELVRPPALRFLLLVTHREEDVADSPFMRELSTRWPEGAIRRDLRVEPLPAEESLRLAATLLGSRDAHSDAAAAAIARESGGSAFLIEELARGMAARKAGEHTAPPLEELLERRLTRAGTGARRLLEVLAVAARPLPAAVAASCVGLTEPVDEVVSALRASRLVRTALRDGREVVETSHDRLREIIVARLPPETLRERHRALAQTFEAGRVVDVEALALHYLAAGDEARATAHAERAAAEAAAKLAFDQAVRLYRMALATFPPESPDAQRLRVRLAEALTWAGRGAEAAEAYRAAAARATRLERVELELEAADQLIASGHIDDGIAAMESVGRALHVRVPSSLPAAVLWLFAYRLLTVLLGWRFTLRPHAEVSAEDRARVDLCSSLTLGLSLARPIFGMCMQTQHLLLALRSGDPFRVARAQIFETVSIAAAGGEEGTRERTLAESAAALAEKYPAHDARAVVVGVGALRWFLHGKWSRARSTCDVALAIYPNNRAGYRTNVQLFWFWSTLFLGQIAEAARAFPALLADADARGDLYSAVNLRVGYSNMLWLVQDDPDTARRQMQNGMALWSNRTFSIQHYRAMLAEANLAMYVGDGARAYAIVTAGWAAMGRSRMLLAQYIRADAAFLRARAALASMTDVGLAPRQRRARVREVERIARRLAGEKMPWVRPLACLVAAGAAIARGDVARAKLELRRAAKSADAAEMRLHGAIARWRLGKLAGGERGARLQSKAERWMDAEGIKAPAKIATLLAPGPWG
jgi:serine/threonine protein kinase